MSAPSDAMVDRRHHMNPDVADEFMRAVHPDLVAAATARFQQLITAALDGRSLDELQACRRQQMRAHLAALDTAILAAVGVDIDFLLDAIEQRAARERGGCELRRSQADARQIAYLAFAETIASGGQRRHAVREALDRIAAVSRRVPDPKTVRGWFDEIARMGLFRDQNGNW